MFLISVNQKIGLFAVLSLTVLLLSLDCFGVSSGEWRTTGNDAGGGRFSPLAEINRSNVQQLERAWTYHTGEFQGRDNRPNPLAFQSTPIVVENRMYFATPTNRVIALDAETGREIWTFDPQIVVRESDGLLRNRGVAFWTGEAATGFATKRILTGTMDGRLIALDAETGERCQDFGRNGEINLREDVDFNEFPAAVYGMTAPPAVYGNLVITGARLPDTFQQGPSGDVRAFDVRTGKRVWRFHTVPRQREFGFETWAANSGRKRTGVNVWTGMSVDTERGLVFIPLGSPSPDFYGGGRKGDNLFANSLVALDARTGKRVWHFQTVHHDLWDYDLPAPPVLATVRRAKQEIPAVALVTKMGFVFVFDRRDGKPLFDIEERPVPRSTVAGEETAPTQPVPVKPAPLVRQTALKREEISEVTPESNRQCLKMFDQMQSGGLYTPFGAKETLIFPGVFGGANWSGASFDASSGLLFVNVNELGAFAKVTPPVGDLTKEVSRHAPNFWDDNRLPCQRPPWGTLNAVDLNSGEIRWRVPLGLVESLAAKGIKDTGSPNLGGTIVTAGKLVFIAGTNDKRFRAFDSENGKLLWETRLEASGHAAPLTYQGTRSKRQFVVIAAGGGGYISDETSDALAAYALPKTAKTVAKGKQ